MSAARETPTMVLHGLVLQFPGNPSTGADPCRSGSRQVGIRTPQPGRLVALLNRHGFAVERLGADGLLVEQGAVADVASLARFFNVPVHHLDHREPGSVWTRA